MASDATPQEVLTDVCELDFPPEKYGETLEDIEATCQEVVERIFRDEDGAIRSGVYGKTMRPLTLEDVHDRPNGVGALSETDNMPRQYRPLWMNYENMLQCSGKYLVTMTRKHAVSGDEACVDRARRTYEATRQLWDNVAEQNFHGRGWMPKPYAGIRKVAEMTGSSADQYADITLGLEAFYTGLATCDEKTVIEDMILSFADWWIDHHYMCEHMGHMCQWWVGNPTLSTAYFLYLHALAYRFCPLKKHLEGFDYWLEMNRKLFVGRLHQPGINTSGVALECLARLVELRPEHRPLWRRAAEVCAEYSVGRIVTTGDTWPQWKGVRSQQNGYAAHYMCIAHEMLPGRGYDDRARRCLEAYSGRSDFYHLSRGQKVAPLHPLVAGDDYRNMFWSEDHIAWMDAYWSLKRLGCLE